MPASFLAKHRTICAVLEDLRRFNGELSDGEDVRYKRIDELIDEAKGYAQSMSAKLMEYKKGTFEAKLEREKTEASEADRTADHIDGFDRDDLGESPDY